jgi:hypothetical protein
MGEPEISTNLPLSTTLDRDGEPVIKQETFLANPIKVMAEIDKQTPERTACFLAFLLVFPATQDSKQQTRRRKWIFTSIVSLTAAAAPLGSTILMRRSPYIFQFFLRKFS